MADTQRIKTLQVLASRSGDGEFGHGVNRAKSVNDV